MLRELERLQSLRSSRLTSLLKGMANDALSEVAQWQGYLHNRVVRISVLPARASSSSLLLLPVLYGRFQGKVGSQLNAGELYTGQWTGCFALSEPTLHSKMLLSALNLMLASAGEQYCTLIDHKVCYEPG